MAIEFDGTEIDVSETVEMCYVKHMRFSRMMVEQFLKHTGREHLEGKVKEIGKNSGLFTVEIIGIRDIMPGAVRGELREKLQKLDLDSDDSREIGFICYLCGAHWLQELMKYSKIIKWLEANKTPYSWNKSNTGAFTIGDPSVLRRVRLTWLDR